MARSWGESMREREANDPEFARQMADARASLERAERVVCEYGTCVSWVDPETGEDLGGFNPVEPPCPCGSRDR